MVQSCRPGAAVGQSGRKGRPKGAKAAVIRTCVVLGSRGGGDRCSAAAAAQLPAVACVDGGRASAHFNTATKTAMQPVQSLPWGRPEPLVLPLLPRHFLQNRVASH